MGHNPFIKRFIVLGCLIGIITFMVLKFRILSYFDQTWLLNNVDFIHSGVLNHPFLCAFLFISVYALLISVALPGSSFCMMAGGFLFGIRYGFLLSFISALLGSTLLFYLSRYFIGDWLHTMYGNELKSINKAIECHGPYYLFLIRMVAALPFSLINMLAGLTTISYINYLKATSFGIIPITFICSILGNNMGTFISTSQSLSTKIAFGLFIGLKIGFIPLMIKIGYGIYARLKKKNGTVL